MKKRSYSLALALAAAVSAPAGAMYINPQGSGQVLLFPYFGVNSGQSTLLTLVNRTDRAKYLKIQFREGYNSRVVLDFNIALAANDAWTSTIFASDTEGAARIMTRDESCTAPDKPAWEAPFPGGGYQQSFLPFSYTGVHEDSGPTNAVRMREGHFEVIELAELGGKLAAAASQHPLDCPSLQALDPWSTDLHPPGGGIAGSFAIVDAAEGTLFGGTATAIDDFSKIHLISELGMIEYLAAGNSRDGEVDAVLPAGSGGTTLTYSTLGTPSRAADALSALLMSDSIYGTMSREAASGSFTEWVLTAPTKFLYTDNEVLGLPLGSTSGALPPFEAVFGGALPGGSCSRYTARAYDLEGRAFAFQEDPEFSLVKPAPGLHPQHALCFATNVVHFSELAKDGATPLLGSKLGSKLWNPSSPIEAANVRIDLGARPGMNRAYNVLPAGSSGPALRGLPLIGFEAVRYVNGDVAPGTLASYATASPLGAEVVCSTASGVPVDCP